MHKGKGSCCSACARKSSKAPRKKAGRKKTAKKRRS